MKTTLREKIETLITTYGMEVAMLETRIRGARDAERYSDLVYFEARKELFNTTIADLKESTK